MADLSAVLRKTIDALPSATPQLRAKVYEKARAAVRRQIDAANPPLPEETVEARLRALEEAIEATEGHYVGPGNSHEGAAPAPAPARAEPVAPPSRPSPPMAPPVAAPPVTAAAAAARPDRGYSIERETTSHPAPPVETRSAAPERPAYQPAPALDRRDSFERRDPPASVDPEPAVSRVGEIGPMSELPLPAQADGSFDEASEARASQSAAGRLDDIPRADISVPGYARPRPSKGRRSPVAAGLTTLVVLGALGAAGYAAYLYQDDIGALFGGEQVAQEQTAPAGEAPAEDVAAVDPAAAPAETPAAPDPGARQFTQRLLPDGTEVDEGPAERAPNAFDEGTDVAAASLVPESTGVPVGEAAPTVSAAEATVAEAGGTPAATVDGGQRAVFYEERSSDRPGAQHGGSVVWSVVNEPPASGQPPEPAIRAVAEVAETQMRMTMTIRRNADETLPASHVIEILFDTPPDFAGGEIENVQRLALKPSEQDRGEPLIGVAGKISDGFFIIALNDLQQAVDNNLALMANQEWIDIPMAYATGQRALISLEKGPAGEEVFREALGAWAART